MTTPRDGWDADEREVLESGALAREIDAVRAHHALGPEEQARLLARIQREARSSKPAPARRWWIWVLPIAATVGIVIAAIVTLRDRDSDTASVTPAGGAGTAIATATPSPVFYLPLEKPAIKISPAALAYRSPGGRNALLADLKPAFDAFRAGDYAGADREFSALSARYPKSVEIAFHQGVARLFLGNGQGAIASLAAAEGLADSSMAWDVAWYRAIAEERVGNPAGARTVLSRLCAQADSRAKTACDALARLPGGRVPAP